MATIPGGRCWGPGFVVTPDNFLLQDVSRAITLNDDERNAPRHPLLDETELEKPEKLRGRAAVLATLGGRGYYHWMFDSLPRAAILRQAGIDFETVDRFVVNECVAPFQWLALEALGIPKSKLVQVNWHPHIQAEELIVPSHAGELSFMPRWACDFLRELLLPHAAATSGTSRPARLYIKRQHAAHRRVANEHEVGQFLEEFGFAIIDPAALPLPEQAALFSSASIVVAPHGAGLANLVFCRPGVKVIEILNPNAVNIMFWSLSSQMELDYYYLFAHGVHAPDGVDLEANREDLTVDLGKLRGTLHLAGVRQP
jgi:capsular polysaccharide biosynthesis protein